MEIRMLWLRELQEKRILDVKWIRGEDNETDIQTKNVSGPLFNKHCEFTAERISTAPAVKAQT